MSADPTPQRRRDSDHRQQLAVALSIAVLALLGSACGSRLGGSQAALAQGSGSGRAGGAIAGTGNTGAGSGVTTTTVATASSSGGTAGTPDAAGTAGHPGTAAAGSPAANPATAAATAAAPCGANGNQAPAGGNGGATGPGVTATTITVGNIASISGVAPGLTQSAQQATEAWAAYVNSTGGICGRQIKVQPFDDGNDSGTNYADAQQACSSDFAMVGNASGFDDGSAQAVGA